MMYPLVPLYDTATPAGDIANGTQFLIAKFLAIRILYCSKMLPPPRGKIVAYTLKTFIAVMRRSAGATSYEHHNKVYVRHASMPQVNTPSRFLYATEFCMLFAC